MEKYTIESIIGILLSSSKYDINQAQPPSCLYKIIHRWARKENPSEDKIVQFLTKTEQKEWKNRAFSLMWLASMLIYWNKRKFYVRKEFNSRRVVLVHQDGCRFIVLQHQYGCHDIM